MSGTTGDRSPFLFLGHEQYTHLVEQVHGDADDGEGDGIGGGGDDGSDDKDDDNGVATVLLHGLAMEDAQFAQQPRQDGYLENDAHGEGKEGEGIDVTFEGNEVLDGGVHLIAGEESEGDGEEDEVAEEDAKHEHEVGGDDERGGVASLVFVEGWRDETVELEDDVGGCHDDADVEAGGHVDDELAGQFCVDELHVGGCAKDGWQEVGTLRGKDDKEDLVLEEKGEEGEECYNDDASQQHSAQFFKMIPKGHASGSCALSSLEASSSVVGSFIPSLKARTPLPAPRMSSGIFLPPKRRRTTTRMTMISVVPRPKNKGCIIL